MGYNKYTNKIVEAETMLKDWQVITSVQQVPIVNKEQEVGVALIDHRKPAALNKALKKNSMDVVWSVNISFRLNFFILRSQEDDTG